MQFIRGGELFMHLSKCRRFEEERAKFYAAQIALAIGYLHKKKIIYRDIKPENILMD
jgi:serine/threonine protein kinase